MITWAITSGNLLRANWTNTTISSSSENYSYPDDYAIDGLIETEWRSISNQGILTIDSGNDNLNIDYIICRFSIERLPTIVDISTSSYADHGYVSIGNNYNGSVTTTTTSNTSTHSRYIALQDASNFHVGNTITISNGVNNQRLLIVNKLENIIEVDRIPLFFESGAEVKLLPAPITLAALSSSESKRYIRVSIAAESPTVAHVQEIIGIKVLYSFDNTYLPLNPSTADITIEFGQIARSITGRAVGRTVTRPPIRRWVITLPRLIQDNKHIIESIMSRDYFGILTDTCEHYDVMFSGSVSLSRRQSSDETLISYASTWNVEEV